MLERKSSRPSCSPSSSFSASGVIHYRPINQGGSPHLSICQSCVRTCSQCQPRNDRDVRIRHTKTSQNVTEMFDCAKFRTVATASSVLNPPAPMLLKGHSKVQCRRGGATRHHVRDHNVAWQSLSVTILRFAPLRLSKAYKHVDHRYQDRNARCIMHPSSHARTRPRLVNSDKHGTGGQTL